MCVPLIIIENQVVNIFKAEKQRRIQRFEVIEISKSDYQAKNGIIREQTVSPLLPMPTVHS